MLVKEEIIHKFDSRESSIIEKRNLIAHIQNNLAKKSFI